MITFQILISLALSGCKPDKTSTECENPSWDNVPLEFDDSWDGELTGVWSSASGETHLVGVSGQHLIGSGDDWEFLTDVGEGPSFSALWGTSGDSLFAIANSKEIWRYSGGEWTGEDLEIPDGWLRGLQGSGEDDIYAVGYAGGLSTTGIAYRRDSTGWQEISLPESTSYNDVHALAPDDVWVVGNSGYVAHFDGSTWTRHDAATEKNLNAVWALDSDSVVAVGGNWQAYTEEGQGTILSYDGSDWTVIDDKTWTVFDDIWANAPDDIWAVGDYPDEEDPDGRIWHFDGNQWSENAGIWNAPRSVWGTAAQDVYVVGFGGNSSEILQRYGCR